MLIPLGGLQCSPCRGCSFRAGLPEGSGLCGTAQVTQQLLGFSLNGSSLIFPVSPRVWVLSCSLLRIQVFFPRLRFNAKVACATGSITAFKEVFLTVVGKIKYMCRQDMGKNSLQVHVPPLGLVYYYFLKLSSKMIHKTLETDFM